MNKKTAYKTIETYTNNLINDKSEISIKINSINLINFLMSLPFDKELLIDSRKEHIKTIILYSQDPILKFNENQLKLTITGLMCDVKLCTNLN